MKFSDVVGHDRIISYLKKAIVNDRISHAYIFNGEDGCGKSLMADIFAAALQCNEDTNERPCGVCKSCLQAFSKNHPDIIKVTHEKTVISVDDIRKQLNSDIIIKPYSGKYKIYIVDEAEKMNEQAQNALLKTIEEPPEYAVIILLTNNAQKFLPTILSRCIKLDFRSVSKKLIKEYLMEKCRIPDYYAELAALFSAGNVGKAKKYASSEEFLEMLKELMGILKNLDNMSAKELTSAVKFFSLRKANIEECIGLMELWFRDVLVYKATKNESLIAYKSELQAVKSQAECRQFSEFTDIFREFESLRTRIRANVNFDASAELFLINVMSQNGGRYD